MQNFTFTLSSDEIGFRSGCVQATSACDACIIVLECLQSEGYIEPVNITVL